MLASLQNDPPLAVAAALTFGSVCHYLLRLPRLLRRRAAAPAGIEPAADGDGVVPLQFGINGKPQRLVKAAYFVVYPALMVGQLGLLCWLNHCGATRESARPLIGGPPAPGSKNPWKNPEPVVVKTAHSKSSFATDVAEARESVVAGMIVTVVAQYYAAKVGSGAADKMPPVLPSVLVLVAVLPMVARRSGRWIERIVGN